MNICGNHKHQHIHKDANWEKTWRHLGGNCEVRAEDSTGAEHSQHALDPKLNPFTRKEKNSLDLNTLNPSLTKLQFWFFFLTLYERPALNPENSAMTLRNCSGMDGWPNYRNNVQTKACTCSCCVCDKQRKPTTTTEQVWFQCHRTSTKSCLWGRG